MAQININGEWKNCTNEEYENFSGTKRIIVGPICLTISEGRVETTILS